MTLSDWQVGAVGAALLVLAAGGGWAAARRAAARRGEVGAEAALRRDAQAEARYRNLFEGAGDAVWETDAQGRVVALNPAGERLFAVGPEGAIGRPVADFLAPDDWARVRPSGVRRAADPFEVAVAPPGREPVTVEVSARALPDGTVQAIARDITERKRLQERAAHSQRLEALGRLAGGVAHDFNNVLTVIAGNAEVLKATVGSDGPAAELAAQILDAAARAGRLTRQLLAFGRAGPAARAPVDLGAAVRGAADLLRGLAAPRTPLEFDLDPGAPPVLADPGLVEQILLNLVVNARDASPPGAPVTVATRATDGGARLTVADRGAGMDAATRARAFEPFFTTKPRGEGTGLGLATVYGAVESLGGRVRLTSAPGEGTTFDIDLPAYVPPPRPAPAAARTLLLVEDDDAVREVARLALERGGYHLLVADCGPQALALAAAHEGPIDLVLTDVMMPHYTGRELAERLAAARPGVRVLYISGYAGEELSRPARGARAEFYLPKPFTVSELLAKVREVAG